MDFLFTEGHDKTLVIKLRKRSIFIVEPSQKESVKNFTDIQPIIKG